MQQSHSAWHSNTMSDGGRVDWCEIRHVSDRMRSRRIISSPSTRRAPRAPALVHLAPNSAEHATPSAVCNGIFTVQPYDGF